MTTTISHSRLRNFSFPLSVLMALFLIDFFSSPAVSASSTEVDRNTVLVEAARRRETLSAPEPLEFAHMSALGIRLIRGDHVELYTDLAESAEVDEIVPVLDAAVGELCRFFEQDPTEYADWRVEAFLMNDREPFEIFGAFSGAPEFENGYSLGQRIWVFDKKQAYYNRFLLLHELVHSFMSWTFGSLNPRWYSEGIAEYLALHRWDGTTLTLGYFPENPEETPGFGRIELIQKAIRDGRAKSLTEIMAFRPDDYHSDETYAWSWGLVALLERHPRYVEAIRAMPYFMMNPDADPIFKELLGKNAPFLEKDWADLAANLTYDYDFDKARINYAAGLLLTEETDIDLDVSAGGWQNSGIELKAGTTYLISASGRYRIEDAHFQRSFPCEANGITLRYHHGRPLGQILAVTAPPPSERTPLQDGPKPSSPKGKEAEKQNENSPLSPWNGAIPLVKKTEEFTPVFSGPLFFRVNIPTGAVSHSEGTVRIHIRKK